MVPFSDLTIASHRWATGAGGWVDGGSLFAGPLIAATLATGAGGHELAALLAPAFALGLAVIHLFAGRLLMVDALPRSRVLSLAGGVSVGYVFVHLLPDIQAVHLMVDQSGTVLAAVEAHVYVIVLIGFTTFYGLEQYVRSQKKSDETDPRSRAFLLHVGSFALYNLLIGWLLLQKVEYGVGNLVTFSVALALHFVVNDYGLRRHHGAAYHDYGRWLVAASVLAGFGAGYILSVRELWVLLLFAFVAGSIVLNAIKEELPTERESRFWAFAVGALGYAGLFIVW